MSPSEPSPRRDDAPLTLWQTLTSVAAAFFGVQSARNRERDFSKGRPLHFIVVGLAMTLAFVLAVWVAVKLALRSAGM
ncbi:DUF2970 domain-containing protein [Sinimarinibacterium thermocellulolyticum]|uniref:DUF2970 domain-containing protein n=1 Tax=Sinimarinibacterium thermocellulolyticum TaxID=3170016 RepID=A0ABV2ACQ7_9GAMM